MSTPLKETKAKKNPVGCKCIDQVQVELKERGLALERLMMIDFSGFSGQPRKASMSPPLLMVRKLDEKSRKRLPSIVCDHCPFCGKKYP